MMWLTQHTLTRRLLSIPAYIMLTLLVLISAPLWIPMIWLLGHIRPSARSGLRCLTFVCLYLLCETAGIVASGWLWLRYGLSRKQQAHYLAANSQLQYWWADTLRRGAEKLFRLRFEIEGEEALNGPAAIVLPRHTSIGDTVLPMSFYAIPKAFRVRYVLKRELLLDPCLDIVGNRLPNAFVNRVAEDMDSELKVLHKLAATAADDDALVIYMEGTRFSTNKRQRILRQLAAKDAPEALRNAERWTTVLPPRPAGALTLMAAAPHKDLLFFAHSGFEGSASFTSLFNGSWMDTTVRLSFWRIPAADIPDDPEGRRALLLEQWELMHRKLSEMADRPA